MRSVPIAVMYVKPGIPAPLLWAGQPRRRSNQPASRYAPGRAPCACRTTPRDPGPEAYLLHILALQLVGARPQALDHVAQQVDHACCCWNREQQQKHMVRAAATSRYLTCRHQRASCFKRMDLLHSMGTHGPACSCNRGRTSCMAMPHARHSCGRRRLTSDVAAPCLGHRHGRLLPQHVLQAGSQAGRKAGRRVGRQA